MIICSASRQLLLLAGTVGTLAVAVCSAAAQQTPASPEAPPPWAQGRPETAIGAKPVVIYDDLPKDEAHGWKFLTIGPDNKLYFNVGAPCNICLPSPAHAQLRRINLDGSGAEVVARGIRQVVGMDWHPVLGQLYFTENSRDWLSEDIPEDKLNRLTQPGKDNFGYPYCHQGNIPAQEFGWGHSCDEFTKPIALLGPHTAALGMRFYTGNMFPSEYRNAIFIARHGS